MATGREHPDAEISQLFGELNHGVRESIDIQINGHSLAIIQQSWDTSFFYADTWNWPSGRKISHLSLSHLSDPPELISEGHLAVLRTSIPDEIGSSMLPTPALLVASFGLPPGRTPGAARWAEMACALPTTASTRDHPAAVYELNVRERLLCVYIFPKCTKEDLDLLHIPVSALLDMVSNQNINNLDLSSRVVQWSDWAHRAFWAADRYHIDRSDRFIIGQRLIRRFHRNFTAFDFSGRRFTTRSVEPPSIANGFPKMPIQQEPGTSFYTGNLQAAGFYPKAILDIPPDGGMWLGVDDEHAVAIVRKRVDPDIHSSLVVYEF
ncbi:hypothetical protein RhiJN_18066 [Ceratobasidium sp. AG-Ba]|nr:hypothetical protein RhiJN_18066 [Ceratobasidium sp. AG-Ba]